MQVIALNDENRLRKEPHDRNTGRQPQYGQLCVTCQAKTIEGYRQCLYCQEHREEPAHERKDLCSPSH